MPRYARVSRFVCVRWFFNQQRTRRLGSQTPSNRNPWPSSFSSFARTFYGISGIGWWDGNESHPLTIWRAENFVWPVVTRLLYIFAFPFNPAVATEGCEKRLLSNRPHSFVFFFSKAILDLARYMPLFFPSFFFLPTYEMTRNGGNKKKMISWTTMRSCVSDCVRSAHPHNRNLKTSQYNGKW